MHYRPMEEGHGLPHNPFKAMVAPRPIAWVSSIDGTGRANLAPFSFFNGVADDPPTLMISFTGLKIGRDERKDTLANIRETGEFVVNVACYGLKDQLNRTSGPWDADVDEFDLAGLAKAESLEVRPPRVADAPGAFECRLTREVRHPDDRNGHPNVTVFGQVHVVHIRDDALVDGIFDITRHQQMARCGYRDYTRVTELFQMDRPTR